MSKQSSGHVAVPYLVSLFSGLILIGGAAVYIYNYLGLGDKDEISEPVARTAATAAYADSHTMLMILDF